MENKNLKKKIVMGKVMQAKCCNSVTILREVGRILCVLLWLVLTTAVFFREGDLAYTLVFGVVLGVGVFFLNNYRRHC